MSIAKVAISIDEGLLRKVDHMVKKHVFPNRSRAIQTAIAEKMRRMDRTRLAQECLKLDPLKEQKLADEGLSSEVDQWPEY